MVNNFAEVRGVVLDRVQMLLEKPRVSAYTPQALVEVICNLLALGWDEYKFNKYMFKEYNSYSRPWWLSEDLDYPIAVNRLKNLTEYLADGNFEL